MWRTKVSLSRPLGRCCDTAGRSGPTTCESLPISVQEDGTEELSGWMNSAQQVAQAMAELHSPQAKAYWLQERNVLCPRCPDREQRIVEYPLTDIPSPRSSPHDSRYLLAVG